MGESSISAAVPLLEYSHVWRWRWLHNVVDVEEATTQIIFSLPIILCNVFYYCIVLTSVMIAGHLGELELAGATLANSWATVTGFAVMVGLSGALETLCGQAFGARLYKTLGIHLQASCMISLSFSTLISIIWHFTEPILLFLHQDPEIAKTAALFVKLLTPSIFAYGILQNILRFLQTQSILLPLVVFSLIPLVVHVGIAYVFVYWTPLGFEGAPLAVSVSMWVSVIGLAVYVVWSERCRSSWEGFSYEAFGFVLLNLRLALPSCSYGVVCVMIFQLKSLEYWAFEILVLIAGLMNDAEESTCLIAMCVNTEDIAYMVVNGLSAAASTRVSNELGAGNIDRAKNAMMVTLKLSMILAVIIVVALGLGHSLWAGLFTDSTTIIKAFACITPLLAISITLDMFQGILSGVARGCGWQYLAVYVNLSMFYLIGFPIAVLLAFKFNLEAKGLWIGLICGLFCQTATLLVVILRATWGRLNLPVQEDSEAFIFV